MPDPLEPSHDRHYRLHHCFIQDLLICPMFQHAHTHCLSHHCCLCWCHLFIQSIINPIMESKRYSNKTIHQTLNRAMPFRVYSSLMRKLSRIVHVHFIRLIAPKFHLVFCLPLHLFHGTGASNILPSTCLSSLLLTCPYHLSLFSVIFFVTCATFTAPFRFCFCLRTGVRTSSM